MVSLFSLGKIKSFSLYFGFFAEKGESDVIEACNILSYVSSIALLIASSMDEHFSTNTLAIYAES